MLLPDGFGPGAHETYGGSLSWTITANEHEFVLPELSVAVEFTIFVPLGKVEPEGGTEVTV